MAFPFTSSFSDAVQEGALGLDRVDDILHNTNRLHPGVCIHQLRLHDRWCQVVLHPRLLYPWVLKHEMVVERLVKIWHLDHVLDLAMASALMLV